MLNVSQEGKESEDKELLFHNKAGEETKFDP